MPYPIGDAKFRATDAEREQTVEVLNAAAAQGCLTADELDERLTAAYAAVTRGQLPPLLADLPPLGPVAPQPMRAATPSSRQSLFWLWAVIPWLHWASWVHAALLTRSPRYWTFTAAYLLPFVAAAITDGLDDVADWAIALEVFVWVVNIIHAWIERPGVARRNRRQPVLA